ncbi:hypothetical protein WJX82_009890 [Trebouxia sp. C0006]
MQLARSPQTVLGNPQCFKQLPTHASVHSVNSRDTLPRGLEHELTVTAVLTKTQPVDVGKISGTDRTSLVLNVT